MNPTFTVRYRGADHPAYVRQADTWQAAAERAIRRAAGRAASVRGWILDNWQTDRAGQITRRNFRATVCGPTRRGRSGAPILGNASVSLAGQGRENIYIQALDNDAARLGG